MSPDVSPSEAAKVLRKLIVVDLDDPSQVKTLDYIHSIHDRFRPFSSKADLFDENIVKFYIELAKAYLSVGNLESVQKILSILKSTNQTPTSLMKQLWRQLEIEHCQCIELIHVGSLAEAGSKLETLISSATELLKMCSKDSSEYDLLLESLYDLVKKAASLNILLEKYQRVSETLEPALKLVIEAYSSDSIEAMALKLLLAISLANQNKISQLTDLCESILSSNPPATVEVASVYSNISEMILSLNHTYLPLCLRLSTVSTEMLNALSVKSESAAFHYATHGVILNALKKFADAKAVLQKAITLLPKDHYRLHLIYHNLGTAYIGLEEFENAIKYLEMAIERYKQGGNKELMAACFGHVGEAYEKLRRHVDAEIAISEAVALKRKFMPGSTQLVVDLQNLAAMNQRKGLKEEAVNLYREALSIIIQHFGESDLQTAFARRLLANALIGVSRIEEAIEECEKCLPAIEKDGSFAQYEHLIRQYCQLLAAVGRQEEAKQLIHRLKVLVKAQLNGK